jgi:hypothetical protein
MTKTNLSSDELSRYIGIRVRNPAAADRYWARCMGQDAALDDETVEKLKGFLKNKLSAEDHEQVCNMLDGDGEAQDEPPPDDVEGKPAMDSLSRRQRMQAADSMLAKRAKDRDDFYARFPDSAKIRIDNSGIQPRARAASYSAAGAASFAAMFPDAQRIKLA